MEPAQSDAASARANSKSPGPLPGKQPDQSMLPPIPGEALNPEQAKTAAKAKHAPSATTWTTWKLYILGLHLALLALLALLLIQASATMVFDSKPCPSATSPGWSTGGGGGSASPFAAVVASGVLPLDNK